MKLLRSSTGRFDKTAAQIVRDLCDMQCKGIAEATDLHFLAVLQQQLNKTEDAEESYGLALKEYQKLENRTSPIVRSMLFVCRIEATSV